MSNTPRKAFGTRNPQSTPEHPLNPSRKPDRSRLTPAPLVSFGTRLPADLVKEVKLAAVQREMSIQEITEAALRSWLAS